MADNASKAVWSLSSTTQGKIRLQGMKSYQVKDGAKVESTNEVGPGSTPVGFKTTPGAKTITFEFYVQKGQLKPDWEAMRVSEEQFSLTKQIVGANRVQYVPCRVSTYDTNGDNEGEHMASVEIVAFEGKPL